ncbi:hypothetical protein K490DRAFT_56007 [Saccharata proteae CBS 121410]|uniref:Uncharacterized protein n=1 Tax=Saccharata proteae CBS 121410 TaxID=1314787 RepID=A0A9P4I0I8_9PEZI|nr:hypothetical protein K490DRAFT_56007 [Saccharata proteae CBS 121410]
MHISSGQQESQRTKTFDRQTSAPLFISATRRPQRSHISHLLIDGFCGPLNIVEATATATTGRRRFARAAKRAHRALVDLNAGADSRFLRPKLPARGPTDQGKGRRPSNEAGPADKDKDKGVMDDGMRKRGPSGPGVCCIREPFWPREQWRAGLELELELELGIGARKCRESVRPSIDERVL